MTRIVVLLCLLSGLSFRFGSNGLGLNAAASAQAGVSDPLARSTQIIVVTTSDWDAVEGHLQRYERATAQDVWRPVGASFSVVVGKHGLGWGIGLTPAGAATLTPPSGSGKMGQPKMEGDGRAPAGVFALGTAFGYAARTLPDSKTPYLALTPATECVDDVESRQYNRLVERTATSDWKSSERMRSAGDAYRWGIVVDHNGTASATAAHPPQRGRGSCIFLHIWQGPRLGPHLGTAGCTAMPQIELEDLLRWLDPKRQPLLVQLPAERYAAAMQRWKLPTVVSLPIVEIPTRASTP